MSVSLICADRQALLIVGGEIDLHTVQTLREGLREATTLCFQVLVDLDNVTFIGAAGLNALVAADNRGKSAESRLQVLTTNPFTLKMMTVTGLRHLVLSA